LDVNRWTVLTPIIVAIIGITGTVIPSLLETSSTQITNNPSIKLDKMLGATDETMFEELMHFDIFSDDDEATLRLINDGGMPATNISLIIDSSKKIINVTKRYGITDIVLPDFSNVVLQNNIPRYVDTNVIKMNISRLMPGEGSAVEVEIKTDGEQTLDDYRAFVMYDQGSAVAKDPSVFAFLSPGYITLNVLVWVALGIWYFYFFRTIKRKRLVQRLLGELIRWRGSIKSNPLTRDYLPKFYIGQMISSFNRKYITGVTDYILVDDLYSKLIEREGKISNSTDNELKKINQQLLTLVQNALWQIDWKKYT
jgi:hypothetical protein